MKPDTIPAVVLGGSGYVAGELLRLLAGHPVFRILAVASESRTGDTLSAAFPHLAGALPDLSFVGFDEARALAVSVPRLAVFSALAHGEAAARIDAFLASTERAGCAARIVDCSADFRHRDAGRYATLYGRPHGAPHLLAAFACALPEHWRGASPLHVAHPGCFTSAATLLSVPLLASGLVEPHFFVTAVTGSTGAGRKLSETTHHPERRSDLFAYAPLAHRHEAEMRALAAQANGGTEPEIAFVPQAGPFARGIHAVVHARLARPSSSDEAQETLAAFYRESPFVRVLPEPPRLAAVVGTNRADLAVSVHDEELVAFAAIDNLTKGAAGGAVQWMNRLFELPETTGLAVPGLGWF